MGRKLATVPILLMFIAPVAAVEAYAVASASHTAASTVTSQEFYSTLQLSLSLSSPNVAENSSVNFTVSLENMGPSAITLPFWGDWPNNGSPYSPFPCSVQYYSFSIYRGNHVGDQIPTANQMLLLLRPGPYECPLIPVTSPEHSYAVFVPGQALQYQYNYSGYFTNDSSAGWSFVHFPPGTYTLYAQDEWGQWVSTLFMVA